MTCPSGEGTAPVIVHTLTCPSSPAVSSRRPSGENATDQIDESLAPLLRLQVPTTWLYSVHFASDGGATTVGGFSTGASMGASMPPSRPAAPVPAAPVPA